MSTESENLSIGVRDWKEGGEGGVGDLMPCYQWRIKNGKLPRSLVMNSYHLDKVLADI